MKKYTRPLFVFFILAISQNALAESFPVNINLSISSPYSPYLVDYTESQKLQVNIQINDPTLLQHPCKFRLTIEGAGITIRTRQNFTPQPTIIQGGSVPNILYGEDLAAYFSPANLDFAGISKSDYIKGAKLPEGVYRFTVEVLDYNRNTVLSNRGTVIAWIILNDPVLLNLPRNGNKVNITEVANIPFTWTPRHTASPNSGFSTEYIFRLVEIWPATRNPYDAFLSQQPLYETTTTATQIVYGPAEPALIPGRKYAWQVQAKDTEGRDLFKNEGKSEVYVFQFGDELGIPENLSLQKANPSSLIVRWEQPVAGTDAVTYTVRYRPHGKRNHDNWYTEKTSDQWRAIPQLQPNTEYEVQVRAEQGVQVTDYGTLKIFKTAVAGANDFVCKSDVSPPKVPANTIPATKLAINDTIYAAGYEVLVRELTANEGGTYTGSGMMIVPWFQSAKVRMTFKNIRVNEQHWLTAGEINSVWNADSKFLVKSEKKVDSTNAPLNGELPINIVATETLIEITGAAIATVTKDEEGNIEVYTTDGDKKVLPKGKSYSIADEVGNGYIVDEKGNITKTTAEEARNAAGRGDRNYIIALTFSKGDGKFGFDEKKYEALSSYYQQLDGGQYIPWKAVTASQPDAVAATLEGTDIAADKVRFEINGSTVPATNNGNNYTLNVRGGAGGMVEELLALYTPTDTSKDNVLGKLNLVSYDELTRNLVIVPVNGATIPGGLTANILSQKLTEIYGQAVAKWDVKLESSINVSLDDTFDDGESGLLTNYTGDMKKVIKAYGKLHDKTYYIFLVSQPKSGGSALGYMPRSKQAGFIFTDNLNSNTAITTIAQEVGHGAFNLKHTFSEFPSLSKSSTDNLMDYGSGQTLCKYQWDNIHDPQKVIGLFENDEEGAMMAETGAFTIYACENILKNKSINYLSAAENCKLYGQFTLADTTTIKEVKINLQVSIAGSKNQMTKDYTIKLNTKVELHLDSMPEGKYVFKGTVDKKSFVSTFYFRKKKYDFACTVCGRDLAITLDKLKAIFPGNKDITQIHVDYLNDALKKASFSTCKRHAHFFSQVAIESANFKDFEEDYWYRLLRIYEIFGSQSNDSYKTLYSQYFWDKNQHLDYISAGKCEHLYEGKEKYTDITDKSKRYKSEGTITKSRNNYTISIPKTFKKDTLGTYVRYSLKDDKKAGENLFNLVYKDKNGNTLDGDGWKYRGRGALQVTGRSNYKATSDKCNSTFSKNFNWETNPDQLKSDTEAIIYSSVAWFMNAFNPISTLDNKTSNQVTGVVNTKREKAAERAQKYKDLIDDFQLYNCEIQ